MASRGTRTARTSGAATERDRAGRAIFKAVKDHFPALIFDQHEFVSSKFHGDPRRPKRRAVASMGIDCDEK